MNSTALITHLFITLAGVTAFANGVESSLGGFKLNSCSANRSRCVEVTSDKTVGSQLKMLHILNRPQVKIVTPQKSESIFAESGYVDLTENQIVLYKKINGKISEIGIDLNSFSANSSESSLSQ